MDKYKDLELMDENIYPDEKVLKKALDKAYKFYNELIKIYDNNEMTYEWRYYRDGKAWLLKVQKKKRTIVWMSAWKGYMKAVIYFPEKYIEKVYELDLDEKIKEFIKSTKNVGKSKPCIFEIRDKEIITEFEKVMRLKIECK